MNREELIEAIFVSMQQMHRGSASKFHTLMGRGDISPSQMELLVLIKQQGPMSAKNVAAAMHMTPGAVTQLAENLVEKRYLVRRADEHDRRIVHLYLAEEGKQKLKELWERRKEMLRRIMQTLDTKELSLMLSIQEKMTAEIEKEVLRTQEEKNT